MLLELLACSELGKNQDELQLNVVAACTNLTYYSCRVSTEHHDICLRCEYVMFFGAAGYTY